MSNIFTILRLRILQNIREPATTIGQMLIFPLALIFILGMALRPMFETPTLNATPVAYYNADSGQMGKQVDEFLANPEVAEFLTVQKVSSVATGEDLLQRGKITALISVPADYSAEIMAGREGAIVITGHPGRPFNVSLVETVMESFIYGGNASYAMATMGSLAPEYRPATGSIVDSPLGDSGPGAMGYYAVTMLVMTIMYGTSYGASGQAENVITPVGLRVRSSPVRPSQQYVGSVLGNLVTIYTSSLVIVALTHFFFGVNWGPRLPLVMGIIFLGVVLSLGLGTMAMTVAKDENRAFAILNVLVVASTFLAGGYVKLSLPAQFGWIQYLSPSYLLQTALFNTVYAGPAKETILVLLALTAIILITFTIAMKVERKVRI